MDEQRIKHLEMIQGVITRFNTNSFQIKGIGITLVSALLAIYAATSKVDFILVAMLPTLFFWFLDAYYLQQERKFRGLYNDIAGTNDKPKNIKTFDMNPKSYIGGSFRYIRSLFSRTIWTIYVFMILILSSIYLFIKF